MFALFVIGLTCFTASMVSAEPEAEADPQFFYNPYPIYNTVYDPAIVHKVAKTPVKTPITTYYPNLFRTPLTSYYPTHYQPAAFYPSYPTFRYPVYYPNVVQTVPTSKVTEDASEEEKSEEVMTKKPLRPIIPLFGNVMRGANVQGVTYLRPNEGVPQVPEHDKVLAYKSVPYTQALVNRVPATKVA